MATNKDSRSHINDSDDKEGLEIAKLQEEILSLRREKVRIWAQVASSVFTLLTVLASLLIATRTIENSNQQFAAAQEHQLELLATQQANEVNLKVVELVTNSESPAEIESKIELLNLLLPENFIPETLIADFNPCDFVNNAGDSNLEELRITTDVRLRIIDLLVENPDNSELIYQLYRDNLGRQYGALNTMLKLRDACGTEYIVQEGFGISPEGSMELYSIVGGGEGTMSVATPIPWPEPAIPLIVPTPTP